jgi:hypothetical protein
MHDVAIHDPAAMPAPLDAWLAKQHKFGVAATAKLVVVQERDVASVRPFSEEP